MTDSPPTRRSTFALLAGLYVSQFLGVGFFYTGLTAILRERGIALEQLGIIQTLGLLWAAKFLWAPLIDRFGSARRGHYRGWLLLLQPAIALARLAMLAVDPVRDFGSLIMVAALVIVLSATQDIAADALAVRALAPDDRGIGNGIQIAGGYLGNILGGGAVLVVYDQWGWRPAIAALVVFTALPSWQVWRYREPARAAAPDAGAAWRSVVTVFRAPGVARWALVLLPLYWIGVTSGYSLVTPMLVDVGWSLTRIGLVTNLLGGALAMGGAVASGALVRRLGRRRAMITFGVAQLVAALGLLPLATGSRDAVLAGAAVVAVNVCYAAVSTIVYTVNTDLSRPASAGSDFTMLASVSFAASLIAGAAALAIAGRFGYPAVIVGSAGLLALGVLAPRFLFVDRATVTSQSGARVDADAGHAPAPLQDVTR